MNPSAGMRLPPPLRGTEMDLSWTHGWSGLVLAYASVQAPMVAGLIRGRAAAHRYLSSPVLALPLTGVAAVGMSAVTPVLAAMGAAPHGLLQFALGTAVSMTLGYAGGQVAAEGDGDGKLHRRGSMVVDDVAVSRGVRDRDRNKSSDLGQNSDTHVHDSHRGRERNNGRRGEPAAHTSRDRPITLAGTVIPEADETKHFKLIGTTGTGKSTAIEEILRTALERGDHAVIADPDAGYLNRFYDAKRGDVILNPFDTRSRKWDLFAEIKNSYDVDQLARSLIPDHEGADRSWRGYARTFFSAVTRQAHEAGVKELGELYRLLVVADTRELRELVKGTPAQPFLDEHNSRMFDSIRSVTSSAVGAIEAIARQTTPGFSIREWVSEAAPGVLFMPYKAGQIAALSSTISGWMRLAIFEAMNQDEPQGMHQPEPQAAQQPRPQAMNRPGAEHPQPAQAPQRAQDPRHTQDTRRLWFVVDELDALGQIDGLKDALARLRKFGGRCVLGFQSIAQVSSTYGQGDAHTIVENCGNTLILRCSASEGGGTARFASQLIGDREVLRTTVSRSRRYNEFIGSVSRSEHLNVEPAVLPSQIEQLPDLAGYLKQASDPRWHRVRLDAMRRWQGQRPDPVREAHEGSRSVPGREGRSHD